MLSGGFVFGALLEAMLGEAVTVGVEEEFFAVGIVSFLKATAFTLGADLFSPALSLWRNRIDRSDCGVLEPAQMLMMASVRPLWLHSSRAGFIHPAILAQ